MARFKIGDCVKCLNTTGIISAVDESSFITVYQMKIRWLAICNIAENRLRKSEGKYRKRAKIGKFKLGDRVSHRICNDAHISFVDDSTNPPKYSITMRMSGKPGLEEKDIEYHYTVLEEMKQKEAEDGREAVELPAQSNNLVTIVFGKQAGK